MADFVKNNNTEDLIKENFSSEKEEDNIILLPENYTKKILDNILEYILVDFQFENIPKEKIKNEQNQIINSKVIPQNNINNQSEKIKKKKKNRRVKNNSLDNSSFMNYSQEFFYNYPFKCRSMKKLRNNYYKNNSFEKTYNEVEFKKQNSILQNEINETIKANKNSEKEKKFYEEKFIMLKNRINSFQKHEKDLNKQLIRWKIQKNNFLKIKQNKENLKQNLLSLDIDKREELEKKKLKIKNEKYKMKIAIENSRKLIIEKKNNDYNKIKNERNILNNKISRNKSFIEEKYIEKIKSIRAEREKYKIEEQKKHFLQSKNVKNYYQIKNEFNKKRTKELKVECEKLEKIEEKYIKMFKQNNEKELINKVNLKKNRAKSTIGKKDKKLFNKINNSEFIENKEKNNNISVNKTLL